jgi:hypothetical protein
MSLINNPHKIMIGLFHSKKSILENALGERYKLFVA